MHVYPALFHDGHWMRHTYNSFCHHKHRWTATGSIICVMFIVLRSKILLSFPYMGNVGNPGPLGMPLIAKLVMYFCSATAVAALCTKVLGPLKKV